MTDYLDTDAIEADAKSFWAKYGTAIIVGAASLVAGFILALLV